ncbi:MAG: Hsp20/alpha crystallin family protein [Chloroflexi bacterium]|nr:Hsp20/alpha crystallin family protein [Chloroflexota bacterium]
MKGESRVEEKRREGEYHVQERRYGAFSRTVMLPGGLNTDRAEASFEHGVLTISVPKPRGRSPRR